MNVDTLAKIVWEYHLMHQQLEKADGIIVPGSHNIMVGDLQRIMIYPEKGWQIAQRVRLKWPRLLRCWSGWGIPVALSSRR